nr:unnamed protein product [Callosobruchus analis]
MELQDNWEYYLFQIFRYYYKTIGHSYRMGFTTVGVIVSKVSTAIWRRLQPIYLPFPTEAVWKESETGFKEKWGFPNCIGSIDGKHVYIKCPSNSGSLHFWYKQRFSIVLLAIVDPDYKLITIDVGSYGKDSDSTIFQRTSFYLKLLDHQLNIPGPKPLPGREQLTPHVFIGDDERKLKYNKRLSSAIRVVESSFGIFVQKWRCFLKPFELKVETVVDVIKAACCLHNFVRAKGELQINEDIIDLNREVPAFRNFQQTNHRSDLTAYAIREQMSAATFDHLLSLCGPYLQKNSPREAIDPSTRLLLTLRFLATGDSYPSLGYAFRISPAAICNIVFETCNVIWYVLSPYMLKLPNGSQWLQISHDYYKLWQFIVLLAVCDAQYFFTYINVGSYGAQSDGGVLKNSPFGDLLHRGHLKIPPDQRLPNTDEGYPLYFIGDEAFPLLVNLMRPYSKKRVGRMPEDELVFNYRLSRARRTIENTLGIMAAIFRIYQRTIDAEPDTVDTIVKATTCLHNYIKQQKGDALMYCSRDYVHREEGGIVIPGQWRCEVSVDCALGDYVLCLGNRNYSREAFTLRNNLKYYLNSVGAVPWQLNYIRRTNSASLKRVVFCHQAIFTSCL